MTDQPNPPETIYVDPHSWIYSNSESDLYSVAYVPADLHDAEVERLRKVEQAAREFAEAYAYEFRTGHGLIKGPIDREHAVLVKSMDSEERKP